MPQALNFRKLNTKYIGLPNVLADGLIVPELIQNAVKPEVIAGLVLDYLANNEKVKVLESKFMELHKELKLDSAEKICDAVARVMKKKF